MESEHFRWTLAEQVAYDLRYYGLDDWTHRLIVETIVRLPDEVQEFVLESCVFISVGHAASGMVLPGRVGERKWLIILEEDLPENSAHGIVAHEVAHAWLCHDLLSPDLPEDCERHAAEMTALWGFVGIGADPDLYAGVRCGDRDSYRSHD